MSGRTIKILAAIVFLGLIFVIGWFLLYNFKEEANVNVMEPAKEFETILPPAQKTGPVSVEGALSERRSVREYRDEALSLQEISQILWAAQGITAPQFGGRTAPSAGATYPLEVYLVVRKAQGVGPGVYRYLPQDHKLMEILEDDVSGQLARAALGQTFVSEAPVNLIFSAVFERTTTRYGERGIQYVYMEVGHAAQNVYLQAQSLGLGTVVAGAFDDRRVKDILNLAEEEVPLYIMPVGKLKS